jgi:hypothetical protein
VLGGGLTLGLMVPFATGCTKKPVVVPTPAPDVAVLTGAIRSEEQLIALYEVVTQAHPDLTARLGPMLAHHRDHLSVLRRHYIPATGETPTPTPTPRPVPPAQPLPALRDAERQAAADRVRDVTGVSAGMAQLLAAIGACEAGHAALLNRTGTGR